MASPLPLTAPAPLPNRLPLLVVSTYSCPRCRRVNRSLPCGGCGWTPETSVGACEPHEDEMIAS